MIQSVEVKADAIKYEKVGWKRGWLPDSCDVKARFESDVYRSSSEEFFGLRMERKFEITTKKGKSKRTLVSSFSLVTSFTPFSNH